MTDEELRHELANIATVLSGVGSLHQDSADRIAALIDAMDEPEPVPIPVFLQCDPPWRDKCFSPYSSLTFCDAGCLVCSATGQAVFAGYDVDPVTFAAAIAAEGAFEGGYLSHPSAVTRAFPRLKWHRDTAKSFFWSQEYEAKETSLIQWPLAEHHSGQLIDPVAFEAIGWHDRPADLDLLRDLLERQPVVLEVDYVPSTANVDQHFVLAYEYVEDPEGGLSDDLWVADPLTGDTSLLLYFSPDWLGPWMEQNRITKVQRTVMGARIWEIDMGGEGT